MLGHQECARPYFDRQATIGRRTVFSWRKSKRWPAGTPAMIRGSMLVPVPTDLIFPGERDEWIEGAEFPTPDAALRLDVDSIEESAWRYFENWEDALAWVGAPAMSAG